MYRLLSVLVLILSTAGGPAPTGATQRDAEAADAAVALSRLEAAGEFNGLYNQLHPDAKRVVPRAAVVGWYEEDVAPLGPGIITVQSVRFENWTWSVTGDRYPDTAVIAYTQPFANGSVVEDVVRLVEHGDGWGWFFGRDRAFVDEQIDRFAVQPTPTTEPTQTSQTIRVAPNADRDCQETAQYWSTDLRMGTNAIAVLSGCRQDRSGTWFLPTGPNDPRLPEPILTPEEERQTAALRAQIEAQLSLSDFAATLPSWMPEQLDRLMGQPPFVKRPVTGWRDPSVMVGNLPSQYAPFLDAFLQDPNRLALRNYARWWFDRRAAAAPLAACDNLNPIACQAVRTQLGIGARPWPWDLTDPFTLVEYLDWALANGQVATQPTPVPTTPPSSSGDTGSSLMSVLTIHVVDASGVPLGGACVEVEVPVGTSTVCDNEQWDGSATAGLIEIRGYPGTYKVRENRPPSGYAVVEDVRSVEVTAAGAAIILVHEAGPRGTEGPAAKPNSSIPSPSQTTGIAGATYTSPQFGYVVTWQSPWEPTTVTSDPEAGDYLRLGTGDVAMEYHAFFTDQPLKQALEAFVAERARTHPGVTPQYQAPGGGLNADSPALWHFTYTRADGVVMGEATIAFSVGSGRGVLMRTVIRPEDDASPRALFYAVSLVLDPVDATAAAQ